MVSALDTALAGLLRAQEKVAKSAERVSRGDLDVDALVDLKRNATDVKIQSKSLSTIADAEKKALDLLA